MAKYLGDDGLTWNDRQFQCFFNFIAWSCLSLGFHVAVDGPNIELHVPFGYFRVGWIGGRGPRRCRKFGYDGFDRQITRLHPEWKATGDTR